MDAERSVEVAIRSATADDIPILLHHRRSMWVDMGYDDPAKLDLAEAAARSYFQSALSDGSYQGFLAVDVANKVVGGGGIVISHWPGDLHERKPRRAMILNMYVEPDCRRRGIARMLMKKMIEWCRDQGFARVGLHSSNDGRALYEELGFKPTNEMRLDLGHPEQS